MEVDHGFEDSQTHGYFSRSQSCSIDVLSPSTSTSEAPEVLKPVLSPHPPHCLTRHRHLTAKTPPHMTTPACMPGVYCSRSSEPTRHTRQLLEYFDEPGTVTLILELGRSAAPDI